MSAAESMRTLSQITFPAIVNAAACFKSTASPCSAPLRQACRHCRLLIRANAAQGSMSALATPRC